MTLRTSLTRAKIKAVEDEISEEIEAEEGPDDERYAKFMEMTDEEADAAVEAASVKYIAEHRERLSRLTRAQLIRYQTYEALRLCLRVRMRLVRLAELRAPVCILEGEVECLRRRQLYLLKIRAWRAGGPEPSFESH